MPINLLNARIGFATNSSSTHSVVIIPGGASDREVADGEFGWNHFTAGSVGAKRAYLGVLLKASLGLPDEIASILVRDLVGVEVREDAYVDHQSTFGFPREWTGRSVHLGFLEEVKRVFDHPDVVILGGNDNDGETHPLMSKSGGTVALPDYLTSQMVARWDEAGFWTLFNRGTGTKLRLSFGETDAARVMPARATVPELVDVKITDHCPYGCSFCYQDSKPEGVHAETNLLGNLAYVLGAMQVFEVAIGGGEPTLHPDFLQILRAFRHEHVVPNFTTRNLAWLRKAKERVPILETAGAFAYSARTTDEVRDFLGLVKRHDVRWRQAAVQMIRGVVDRQTFVASLKLCNEAGVPFTFLGYKEAGRAAGQPPAEGFDWVSAALETKEREWSRVAIGIDTALARTSQEALVRAGVSPTLYDLGEGTFSMYIDATRPWTVAPSSYSGPDTEVQIGNRWLQAERIVKAFRCFGGGREC